MSSDGPSNQHEIGAFIHCGLCLAELPDGTSPRDRARIEIGWTVRGFQAWCVRHECNIMHVDFEGQQHPANTSRRSDA
jgi:hypothetical protein